MGCGTAGPAAAVMLARAGHRVQIFERAEQPGPAGAGLLIQPAGLGVLQRLGVLHDVMELGERIDRLHGRTVAGRDVLDVRYADRGPGQFGLGVQRGLLFGVLEAAARVAGVEITTGFPVRGLAPDGARARLIAADGRAAGPFDLVIAADGARSALRGPSGLTRRARAYPWGAVWFVADDPEGRFRGNLAQVYRGTSTMVGLLPTGRLSAGSTRRVSLFWSVPAAEAARVCAEPRTLAARIAALMPEAGGLVDQLTGNDQLVFAGYHDVVLRRPGAGALVLIGDAAHAMSPQLGLGANLALADAAALADALARSTTIGGAIAAYARARRGPTAYYQFVSRWLTPVFQSGWDRVPGVAGARDRLFPLTWRFGPARRQVLDALVGAKMGWLTRRAVWPEPGWDREN